MKGKKKVILRVAIVMLAISVTLFVVLKFVDGDRIDHSGKSQKEGDQSMYLSDLDWKSATSEPVIDVTEEDDTIRLKNNNRRSVEFAKGLSIPVNSEVVYDLSKFGYHYLTSWIGVRDPSEATSPVKIKIYADDRLEYESKSGEEALTHHKPMEFINIDISEAKQLKIVVEYLDGEHDSQSGYADFGNIQLHIKNPITRNDNKITEYDGMKLIFHDEFEGDEIDDQKWQLSTTPENGSHHYANVVGKDENIWQEDGNLLIQAKEYLGSEDYKTTSASIKTEDRFDFRYGRVDVRAKIPTETGMWPAIWMMPHDADYGWPMAGEIDIMELVSQEPHIIYSTIHSGIYETAYYRNPGGTFRIEQGTFYDDYHVYSMIWEPGVFYFLVDDELISEINDWENYVTDEGEDDIIERDYPAPFDKSFYLKLNLATGGGWSEDVDETTRYGDRTTLKFDYIRVYQAEKPQYNYSTDARDLPEKQGAVWYTQKLNESIWENFTSFDASTAGWTDDPEGTGDTQAFVSPQGISANFGKESPYQASAIAFRAPYQGYVKVSLQEEVELTQAGEVTFKITKGDQTTTQSDILRSETLTQQSADISEIETFIKVEADDYIRFEILTSKNEVKNFKPVVEYIDVDEYRAAK